ncbi:hypothetical protein KJ849_03840 [bacterium]|nr:hypothetical protein [bacterium]MBU2599691.1 hypothetical protein [bacterium]
MEDYQDIDNLRKIEKARYQVKQEMFLSHKSSLLAVLFSMLIPGGGQIYAHAFIKGFLWLSFFLVLTSLNFGIKKIILPIASPLNIFISLINIFLWLFILYDAHRSVKLYNLGKASFLTRQMIIFLIIFEIIILLILSMIGRLV